MEDDIWRLFASSREEQIQNGTDRTFWEVFVPFYTSMIQHLKPSLVLDVGCGTGHLAREVLHEEIYYTGIDHSQSMIEACQRTLFGRKNTKIILGKIEGFSVDREFDVAILHLSLHTSPHLRLIIDATTRSLVTNGSLIAVIPHPCFYEAPPKWRYLAEEYKNREFEIFGNKVGFTIPYIHRPLSAYFKSFVDGGLELTDFREIGERQSDDDRVIPRYASFLWQKR